MTKRDRERFETATHSLRTHASIRPHLRGDRLAIGSLSTAEVHALLDVPEDVGYYFLLAAAELSRARLKQKMRDADVQIVERRLRRAHAIRLELPGQVSFSGNARAAATLRTRDFSRRQAGGTEQLFRERLAAEKIPIAMSPPLRQIPGLLVQRRKPDGVFPDPATRLPPRIYLEIKKVRRVSDDIQKRLYEIAEASLEMKLLYGGLKLDGFRVSSLDETLRQGTKIGSAIREQILEASPTVVAVLLCPREEAEKYRSGGEVFIDRIFFQEEIEECIAFLRDETSRPSL